MLNHQEAFLIARTSRMSAFIPNQEDVEYPIINVEAENEHFEVSDLIISWMETFKLKSSAKNGSVSSGINNKKASSDKSEGRPDDDRESTDEDDQDEGRACCNGDSVTDDNKEEGYEDDDKKSDVKDSDSEKEFDAFEKAEILRNILPPPSTHHQLSAPGVAWNLVRIFSEKNGLDIIQNSTPPDRFNTDNTTSDTTTTTPIRNQIVDNLPSYKTSPRQKSDSSFLVHSNETSKNQQQIPNSHDQFISAGVRMRGNDEWAPPRAQIIFNIHQETSFKKSMQKQNYRCAGCGTKIDLDLARRLVLYCHYLGKYFCKCCFSHKSIYLPGYILQKWDFHKYPVSHFALQLLDRISNEPLFNINDINASLYRKVKKLKNLIDIRMQLHYLKIYITTCTQNDKLSGEFTSFTHPHLLQDDVHIYSLNNLVEVQYGKLYEYLNDLVTRSIAHIAQCDRCRAKGHYCQLCGPSSLMSSMILSSADPNQFPRLKHSSSIEQNISVSGNQAVTPTGKTTLLADTNSRQQATSNHSRSSSGNYSSFTPSLSLSGIGNGGGIQQQPQSVATTTTNNLISVNVNDHELIFPFEIGRVAQCRSCGCCFHLQCFLEADQNCPKCERIQRRRTEMMLNGGTSNSSIDGAP